MIYFNNGASSFPKPEIVANSVLSSLSEPAIYNPNSGNERDLKDVFYSCRSRLAELFKAPEPNRIFFSSGSTESLNLALRGLDFRNSHIVSTKTEHNSVIRPLMRLKEESNTDFSFVDCDYRGYVDPDIIKNTIKSTTKAIVINHCSNVNGTVQDIKEICKIAHDHGTIVIVDASQSAGAVPIDISDWDIDIMAFTGHKSLFGLSGTGGIYIKEGLDVKPLKVGGTGILSDLLTHPSEIPQLYEAGTQNYTGIVALNAGLGFILETGLDKIIEKKKNHILKIMQSAEQMPEITSYHHPKMNSFTNFCFNITNIVPNEVTYLLESSFGFKLRAGLHCASLMREPLGVMPWGTVRASPGYFTKDEEIDLFIEALKAAVSFFKEV
ncbi:MAG: aminotransferase class V-fold PLP-dependent enzyme [Candidatus Kapabacteria bacterium]|nr:aminotransferase class V-fold PLP-dependent enzyme [Candidatus Kapabacteria bacterium]